MNQPQQFSLEIPFEANFNLLEPLYYFKDSKDCGSFHQVALKAGSHNLTLTHKKDSVYLVNDVEGNSFTASVTFKQGIYKFSGLAEHSIEYSKQDFNLYRNGKNGCSLRPAQSGALYSLLSHWSLSYDACTIVLPTGTGKTETMLVAVLADNAQRVLVVVPTKDLKKQLSQKFETWGMLRQLGVISGATSNPKVLILDKIISSNKDILDMQSAEIIVTTPGLIARANFSLLEALKGTFSHIFFDEAHHVAAAGWKRIKTQFQDSKIVQFTATPFRNDKKPIEGKILYNYSLARALKDNCFSKISLISVDERHPKRKDKAIADAAIQRLKEDRANGWTRHKVMVRTEKSKHAEELYKSYKEWFPDERIVVVHNETRGQAKIVEEIKRGLYDIVICVDMLKEGFDYPDFKIAAVHKLHKSLAVLLQFIGRFTRTQEGLGDASFVVNFADENLSVELENLLQEGSGWEEVISEIADARKADAESLLSFLQGCKPFSGFDSPDTELNPKLVYPALSCMCYKAAKVDWNNFKLAFNLSKYALTQPYYNPDENVFYFTTQKREKVKWARTDKLRDQTWNLIVIHFDAATQLLYIGFSEKTLEIDKLVECLTESTPDRLAGDPVFRAFDSINRLSIVHAGIFKPASHLHRYSRLSGSDVTTELSRWKSGTRCQKSDFVGVGFRDGFPVSVGASVKGKIWSPARVGDLKQWKSWCIKMGKLITDDSIDSNKLLEDSAEKTELSLYPDNLIVMACDWSEELYDKIHKITVSSGSNPYLLNEAYIKLLSTKDDKAQFVFYLQNEKIEFSIRLGGERGHNIEGLDKSRFFVEGLKSEPLDLKKFFEQYPPTMFLLNGDTISGCILTRYTLMAPVRIPSDRIESLGWEEVQYSAESMYKGTLQRKNSVQEYMMKRLVNQGAKVVFNDDNSGESADIVAIFHDADTIRFEMVHCKYSKDIAGARLSDLYEVCGQAIVSLRYKWKPEELLKHMERRDNTGVLQGRRFYHGSKVDIENIRRALRYSEVSFEFAVAQPGVNIQQLNDEMKDFLSSVYSTVVDMTETKLKCYFNSK